MSATSIEALVIGFSSWKQVPTALMYCEGERARAELLGLRSSESY